MRDKTDHKPRGTASASAASARSVRSDLEQRGVSPQLSQGVAERLEVIAADLDCREYRAVLDGVAAACAFPAERGVDSGEPDLAELRRLVEGFSGELRKLDEGLQILSTYVARMTARTTSTGRTPTLH
jgi:hypothetical protein